MHVQACNVLQESCKAGIPTHAPPSCVQVVTEHNREGVRAIRYSERKGERVCVVCVDTWLKKQ